MALVVSVAGCTREQSKTEGPRQSSGDRATATTVLASIANDDKPPHAATGHAGEPASENQPASFQVTFSESGKGVAYLVDRGGKVSVVHNRSRGKEYAAVGAMVLSPDGQRLAYTAQVDGKWRMVVDGKEGSAYDTLLAPVFSPDGKHVVYQATLGDKYFLVVDATPNAGTRASYTTPVFSSDSNKIVFVEASASASEIQLIVSDLKFRPLNSKKSIGDQMYIANSAKTSIAAERVVDGKHRIVTFTFAKPDVVREGPAYDLIERVTISDEGESVAYCALKGGKRLLVMDGREESLPKGLLPELPVIRPDRKGVGLLLASDGMVSLHQSFYNTTEHGKKYSEATSLTYSKDSRFSAYAARQGENWFVVVNGKEGPAYDKVVTPLFSPDSRFLVYRARKNGKRFVVVADTNGKTIKELPSYEQVFEVHFTSDGSSIAYGAKDGNNLVWKVEKL